MCYFLKIICWRKLEVVRPDTAGILVSVEQTWGSFYEKAEINESHIDGTACNGAQSVA